MLWKPKQIRAIFSFWMAWNLLIIERVYIIIASRLGSIGGFKNLIVLIVDCLRKFGWLTPITDGRAQLHLRRVVLSMHKVEVRYLHAEGHSSLLLKGIYTHGARIAWSIWLYMLYNICLVILFQKILAAASHKRYKYYLLFVEFQIAILFSRNIPWVCCLYIFVLSVKN